MNYSYSKELIAIVGGGLLGRLLAWRLLRLGHRVQLLEKTPFDQPRSAAHTAAAMISPMSEVVVSERAIFDMGMTSLALWPEWIAQLQQDSGLSVQYQAQGSVVVAHPADDAELQQFHRELNHHLGSDNPAKWLTRAEINALEPDLSQQFDRALYLPGEAHLDNRTLLRALLSAIRRLGGQCHDCVEVSFEPKLSCDQDHVSFDDVGLLVDCRGMGARESNSALRGVRGEVLWVQTDEVRIQHPIRLMHPRYKLYLVPKPNQQYIIGATEIESEDRSPVSVQSMLELCSALYTLNPAFAEARIVELDANLRPALWDNMPSIEQHTLACSNLPLVKINGLYRHGYLLAPYLVDKLLNQYFPPSLQHGKTVTL